MLLPQSYYMQNPNLSEGADSISGQLHRNKECPITGITKSGSLEEDDVGKQCSESAFTCQSVVVFWGGRVYTENSHHFWHCPIKLEFFRTICMFGS